MDYCISIENTTLKMSIIDSLWYILFGVETLSASVINTFI